MEAAFSFETVEKKKRTADCKKQKSSHNLSTIHHDNL
jgi:hypothetical protein